MKDFGINDLPCPSCQSGYSGLHVCGMPDYCLCDRGENHVKPGAESTAVQAELDVVERIINLWNSDEGWIPGDAYKELAEALGVSVDRLTHWDSDKGKRVEGR